MELNSMVITSLIASNKWEILKHIWILEEVNILEYFKELH